MVNSTKRVCKTCVYLSPRVSTAFGKVEYKVCSFFETFELPWSATRPISPIIGERHWNPHMTHNPYIPDSIGKDWTEVMDCAQHKEVNYG